MFTSKAGMMEATIVEHPIVPQAKGRLPAQNSQHSSFFVTYEWS
jgi:hypothetical protein